MTVLLLCLVAGYVLGSIALLMAREDARDRTARDIARITAALAAPRRALIPEDWPRRQTPSDLPARAGLVVAVDRPGRHRAPELPEELTTTGQFWRIVDNLGDLWEPCAHCATPEDGEPAHAGCPGCCCPCGLAEVVS
jgi:hypothetical protein